MELWGWLVGYAVLFALLHLVLYYYYVRRGDGDRSSTPPLTDGNLTGARSGSRPERYRGGREHADPEGRHDSRRQSDADGRHDRDRRSGSEGARDRGRRSDADDRRDSTHPLEDESIRELGEESPPGSNEKSAPGPGDQSDFRPDGETIECPHCQVPNAADRTYTYCWNCISALRR